MENLISHDIGTVIIVAMMIAAAGIAVWMFTTGRKNISAAMGGLALLLLAILGIRRDAGKGRKAKPKIPIVPGTEGREVANAGQDGLAEDQKVDEKAREEMTTDPGTGPTLADDANSMLAKAKARKN